VPNKNYINGRNKEYTAINRLKAEGAVIAQRSAGSKSPIDVWALMSDGRVRMVQVKKDTSPLKLELLQELHVLPPNTLELWHWADGDFEITVV
jgi:hypothetical protein